MTFDVFLDKPYLFSNKMLYPYMCLSLLLLHILTRMLIIKRFSLAFNMRLLVFSILIKLAAYRDISLCRLDYL